VACPSHKSQEWKPNLAFFWTFPNNNAGRRTDFRDKIRELFSGELFSGELFSGAALLPENVVPVIPLQKKALQKKALDFCLENQSCDPRSTAVRN